MSHLRFNLILAARDAGDHDFADYLETAKHVDRKNLVAWARNYDMVA